MFNLVTRHIADLVHISTRSCHSTNSWTNAIANTTFERSYASRKSCPAAGSSCAYT